MKSALLAIFFVFSFITQASAETKFINDKLVVPLRAGEGLQFKIVHKGIKSGTSLEILEKNRATGYSKVRTPGGIEGFLPSRFLTSTPIARDLLAKSNAELRKAKTRLSSLSEKVSTLSQKDDELNQSFTTLSANFKKQSKAYNELKNVSSNAVNLDNRNSELRLENEKLKNDVELLTAENYRLKDNSTTNNWMIGGGLVIFGMFLAVVLPLFKPEKKSDGWS